MIFNEFDGAWKLALDQEQKLERKFIKQGDFTYCVYAIIIDNILVYIGKCKDMWKRLDTYRNSKYWKNAHISNIVKTDKIENAIRKKRNVILLVKEYTEETYSDIEETLIQKLKPDWNNKHVNPYN